MMDNRSGQFETAETMDELRARIPEQHRGPAFQGGETITLRGGDFRVAGVDGAEITLHYVGPAKETRRERRAKGRRP